MFPYQPLEASYRRSFLLGVLNGLFFNTAAALLSSSTVIPLFVSRLTDSKILIGLSGTLETMGWFMPQLLAAALTLHHASQLKIYHKAAYLRIASFFFLVLTVFLLPLKNPSLCLILFFLLYSVFSIGAGMAGVSFVDIVGRSIPAQRRGSFFAMRMILGGALGILAGLAVNRFLVLLDYPGNFGMIFLFAFIFIVGGLISFMVVNEPKLLTPRVKRTAMQNIKIAYAFFKSNRNYQSLFWVRTAVSSFLLGYPFYIIFAKQVLGYPTGSAGIFLAFEMGGFLLSNFLWGYLSDRINNRLVLLLSAVCAALTPLLAITTFWTPLPVYVFGFSFFLLGAAESGLFVGFINYILEIAPDEHRPLYLGFLHSLVSLTFLLPALGGVILEISSYKFLFGLLLILGIASTYLAYRLYRLPDRTAN